MNFTHKVCNRCHQSLPTEFFKEVYKTNGNGEKRLYKNSYCHSCEIQRQHEYNKKRGRKAGSVPLDEYRNTRAKAKQERLTRLAEQKAERKKQREIAKQEKAKQRELNRQKRYEEGKAKWDAWHKEWLESGAIDEARAIAKQKRTEQLQAGVKECSLCGVEQPMSQFHMRTRKRKDGSTYKVPYSHCKTCRRADNKKHEQTPTGKATKKRNRSAYDRRNRQATPSWLTSEQKQDIAAIYEHMRDCKAVTGEDYHVDHIVPIRGENVCGLHVSWNLQVMPADVNISKSNSLEDTPYGPLEQVP